jgi:hypothetical protein
MDGARVAAAADDNPMLFSDARAPKRAKFAHLYLSANGDCWLWVHGSMGSKTTIEVMQ